MEKIKFAIVGSGWRSKFYIRVVKNHGDLFEITSMLFRSEEKAVKFRDEFKINATTSRSELIDGKPDFVVVAVNKRDVFSVTEQYLKLGIPVLAETPAGLRVEDLNTLWEMKNNDGCKIQIAEQYFLYPYFKEMLQEIERGTIGETLFVSISAIHDYHAASILRKCLGIGQESFKLSGNSYKSKIVLTNSREGKITDGRVGDMVRSIIIIEFCSGKTALYNFSGAQYSSDILSNNITVQGVKGEINNENITYVDKQNNIQCKKITKSLSNYYKTDEEVICKMLLGMKQYLDNGDEFYPLSDALQDAYISILMHSAVNDSKVIESKKQGWH